MPLLEAWDTRDDDNFLGTGTFSRELYARLRHTRRFIVFATVSGIHVLIQDGENRFEIQRDAFGTRPFRTRSRCRCRDRFGNTTTHLHRCRTSRIRTASSRERTTRLVTKLSPRSAALSRQRYIGRNSSESPTGMRALITKTISKKATLRICVPHSTGYQRYLTSADWMIDEKCQ